MRVGAAQDLLCAGYDTVAIMRAGGWKSINVLARYLEYAEHNVWTDPEDERRPHPGHDYAAAQTASDIPWRVSPGSTCAR